MTRSFAVLLVIAAVAFVGISTVAAIQCNESMVGKSYKADTPLYYMTCVDANTEMELTCLAGSGYINNGTVTGCVPWQLWSCTSKEAAPECSAGCVGSFFPANNPQNYYQCTSTGNYTVGSCPDGTAFVPYAATNDLSLSCVPWANWWKACPY